MARALIVGCGRLGTELGSNLLADGWAVRGTSRDAQGAERIEIAGFEGAVADPDRVGSVLEHVGDVAVVVWALGSASGPTATDVNGPRLESMLERTVDTPVRGFVFDSGPATVNGDGAALVNRAEETWRIPTRVVSVSRDDCGAWVQAMRCAVAELLG